MQVSSVLQDGLLAAIESLPLARRGEWHARLQRLADSSSLGFHFACDQCALDVLRGLFPSRLVVPTLFSQVDL
jgi:hypothetical protein